MKQMRRKFSPEFKTETALETRGERLVLSALFRQSGEVYPRQR